MLSSKRKLNQPEDSDSNESEPKVNTELNQSIQKEKSCTENKLRKIIETHFNEEINYKKYELDKINERIFEAQNMLDKLRVCIVCSYYSLNGQLPLSDYINHPAVSSLKCEHLDLAINHCKDLQLNTLNSNLNDDLKESNQNDSNNNFNNQQFDIKINVGNVSKYLNNLNNQVNKSRNDEVECLESSQYNQELITHKWMIYIRSPNCPKLDNYIKKVIFYLHSSYKPYDLVEVKSAPFQLIRRGWGEFPIHVQIHFKDARNKRIDLTHNLKLDWTQTGLQTFGGETPVQTKLVIKPTDYVADNTRENKQKQESQTSLNTNLNEQSVLNENESLKRNISSSSLSSYSNLSPFPVLSSKSLLLNSDLSPSNFISSEFDLNQSIAQTQPINPTFDELIMNISTNQNQAQNSTSNSKKVSSPSLDELLNLRPKTIQVPKQPIKQISSIKAVLIPEKKDTLNKLPQIVKPLIPTIVPSMLNKQVSVSNPNKVVIYKVGSDDVSKKEAAAVAESNLKTRPEPNQLNQSLSSKKVKLSSDQLTKIKTKQELTSINVINNKPKQENVYSIEYLINFLKEKPKLNINFEALIKQCLKSCPIVLNENETCKILKKKKPVFTARSIHEFYSWPYAKRKANEWIRACYIKRKCAQLIEYLSRFYNTKLSVEIWSTKSVLLWLRSHGYTPLEYQHMQTALVYQNLSYIDSFTSLDFDYKIDLIQEDFLIDVETVEANEHKLRTNSKKSIQNNELDQNIDELNQIEMCEGSKYIKELIDSLNLRTSPIYLAPRQDTEMNQSDQNVFACNLVEKFMFVIAKRFAEDLVRQTCSDLYYSNTNKQLMDVNSRKIAQQQLSHNQKFPNSLNVLDVFNTINMHEKYDFLTNKHMARSLNKNCNDNLKKNISEI